MTLKPNFFIPGAPKCGTTALAAWLGEHPNIYLSPMKEPNFYCTDLRISNGRSRGEYERLFKGGGPAHLAIGEASVWYLYSRQAIQNILKELPQAKFIVCLRNPVEMAYSLHGQHIMAANEHIKAFDRAWEAQSQRVQGENISRLCVDSKLLLYGPICKLGEQIERLYRICHPDRIHAVFLDDIKADAGAEYLKVLKFLGVEDDGRMEFLVVNPASKRRFPRLHKAVKTLNMSRRRLGVPRIGTGVMRQLNRLNRRESERGGLDESTRSKLIAYFIADIEKLENLFGRDLGHWKG